MRASRAVFIRSTIMKLQYVFFFDKVPNNHHFISIRPWTCVFTLSTVRHVFWVMFVKPQCWSHLGNPGVFKRGHEGHTSCAQMLLSHCFVVGSGLEVSVKGKKKDLQQVISCSQLISTLWFGNAKYGLPRILSGSFLVWLSPERQW